MKNLGWILIRNFSRLLDGLGVKVRFGFYCDDIMVTDIGMFGCWFCFLLDFYLREVFIRSKG